MEYLLSVLLLLVMAVATSDAFTKYDAPPRIVHPANLDNPRNLVIVGNVSNLDNTLKCEADNADSIEWAYIKNRGQETLNSISYDVWIKPDAIRLRNSGYLQRVITDRGLVDRRERRDQNGYYICIAEISVNGMEYKTMTPPIRFISPDARYRYRLDLQPQVSAVALSQPHSLKCIETDEIELTPGDLLDLNIIKFSWFKKAENVEQIDESSRITINKKTGDLYFGYIIPDDHTGGADTDPEYQCRMVIADRPTELIGSRHRLVVESPTDNSRAGLQLTYPVNAEDLSVSCVEGEECLLTCIYGGRDWRNDKDPPSPLFTEPRTGFPVDRHGKTAEFTAIDDAEGTWTCGITELQDPVAIEVTIENYPRIPPGDMMSRFVEVGSDVVFECSPSNINIDQLSFYFNGKLVTPPAKPGGKANPSFIEYTAGSTSLRISNAQRAHSAMVSCLAYNNAGTKFKTAQLNVYERPNMTVSPEGGYSIAKSQSNDTESLSFTCKAKLDPKVTSARIHWKTNHTAPELQGEIKGTHEFGVKSVTTGGYSRIRNEIESVLEFNVDLKTQNTIFGGHWWCVVRFEIPGAASPIIAQSLAEPFTTTLPKRVGSRVEQAGFTDWWIIGVVVAVFFILLIVILIVCCVKQQKGEQYYVDEKERMAGHNPEEEMGQYGFSDYKRPATGGYMPMYMSDQDPIKGSRTSMDMSDKPLDSEGGSMDEYGDIDPGRFNEDGSFIGQYGKSSTNIDV